MMRAFLTAMMALALGACATTRDSAALDPRDPYEAFNRNVFAFNQGVDKIALKPLTSVYRAVTPVPARRGISRVFANLTEPLSFVNNLLQGKPERAANNVGRFVINTTIGVGGLADHATDLGLQPTPEDFGQTLAVWGARRSPYLVLPLLGPSTIRDGVGQVVHRAADPVGIGLEEIGASGLEKAGVTALRVIDVRSQLIDTGVDAILETSADPYAAARSAYFQRREAEIEDAAAQAGETGVDEQLQRALDEAPEPPSGEETIPN